MEPKVVLADAGAERAGGEMRGPHEIEHSAVTSHAGDEPLRQITHSYDATADIGGSPESFTSEERAERDAWLALFAALGNNINAMDKDDPIHRKLREEDESIGE